jgi:hypothetical protein
MQFFCQQIWEQHDMRVLQNMTWFRNAKHSGANCKQQMIYVHLYVEPSSSGIAALDTKIVLHCS